MHSEHYSHSLKEELIRGLNEDLSNEYQAIIMYNSYAAMVSGIHRPLLKAFFEEEIPDELKHAQFLANKITALGGEPVTDPVSFKLATDSHNMLKQVLEAEAATIRRYVERRKQAEEFGDYGLATDLDDIISDETRHREETEKLLHEFDERQ